MFRCISHQQPARPARLRNGFWKASLVQCSWTVLILGASLAPGQETLVAPSAEKESVSKIEILGESSAKRDISPEEYIRQADVIKKAVTQKTPSQPGSNRISLNQGELPTDAPPRPPTEAFQTDPTANRRTVENSTIHLVNQAASPEEHIRLAEIQKARSEKSQVHDRPAFDSPPPGNRAPIPLTSENSPSGQVLRLSPDVAVTTSDLRRLSPEEQIAEMDRLNDESRVKRRMRIESQDNETSTTKTQE